LFFSIGKHHIWFLEKSACEINQYHNGMQNHILKNTIIGQFALETTQNCMQNAAFCFIPFFILLSQESDKCTIFWTNSHLLRRCQYPSFSVDCL